MRAVRTFPEAVLPPKPSNQPWRPIPIGTPAGVCRGHQLEGGSCVQTVYWIVNPATGARMPVSIAFDGARAPDPERDPNQLDAFSAPGAEPLAGRGVSHFVDCPDREAFSKRGAR
jgi:hypothetical protein